MQHLIRSETTGSETDWQALAVRRLGYITAAAGLFCLIGMGLFFLRQPNLGVRAGSERPISLIVIGLCACCLVSWMCWRSKWQPSVKLGIGLVYLVVSCGLASMFRHWLPYAPSDVVRGTSPVAIMLLFFAVMIPVKPKQMLWAALGVLLVDPLALGVTVAMGNPNPPWNLWLWLMMPNLLVVVLAVITSQQLFRLEKSIQKVREMGSYALERLLGAGGMGEVWLARHQSLARPAAIKLIRTETLGGRDDASVSALIQRFVREAKATAQLQSPHTIQVFDFGTAKDGSFYYVMELLDGMDLDSLVEAEGPLPPERAVFLLMQICHSLEEAHSSGLYHRDIKPANIYICRQGLEFDFVKILDFGIVKIESQEDSKLTKEGSVMGSPAFLPPEQIKGKQISARTDIYAVGCVAYWMLTADYVFPKDNAASMLVAHLIEEPEPPSVRLGRPVPEALEQLVMWCLQKSPEDRPASTVEVMRILRSTGLVGGWSQAQAHSWWEDHERLLPDSPALDSPVLDSSKDHSAKSFSATEMITPAK